MEGEGRKKKKPLTNSICEGLQPVCRQACISITHMMERPIHHGCGGGAGGLTIEARARHLNTFGERLPLLLLSASSSLGLAEGATRRTTKAPPSALRPSVTKRVHYCLPQGGAEIIKAIVLRRAKLEVETQPLLRLCSSTAASSRNAAAVWSSCHVGQSFS